MPIKYPMELMELDSTHVLGYLDKGHVDRKTFARAIDFSWEAAVDDLEKIEYRLARWLPPDPGYGDLELRFVDEPGRGVFKCTYVDLDDVHYPD